MTVRKKTVTKKATKKKVAKRKVGRPTKYRPEYCDYLKIHLAKGLSYEIFGACLPDYDETAMHVSKATVYTWEKEHPDFLYAKKEAWELCRAYYEKIAGDYMTHTKEGRQLNSTVWIFNMKNRFGWKDKKEIEIGNKEDETFKFAFDLSEKPEG